MKVAITGASGFIGTHLTQRLEAEGHELVLISRKRT
jgi:nucleoside-diphosphate-sugar epimerase